jgi:hypothetical protein
MSSRKVRSIVLAASLIGALVMGSTALSASADTGGAFHVRANLTGFEEVPSNNTNGHASLSAKVTPAAITFTLTYTNLSAAPTSAHIHVGQILVNGGVSVFFCGGGGQPACPTTTSGTVTGTISAANVVGPTGQGFAAGDLAALERAIKGGVTYANIHSANFPAGEIRGQVHFG